MKKIYLKVEHCRIEEVLGLRVSVARFVFVPIALHRQYICKRCEEITGRPRCSSYSRLREACHLLKHHEFIMEVLNEKE